MPGLNFPVRADTSQFDDAMNRARNTSSTATRYITQQFVKLSQDIIAASAAGGAGVTSELLKTQAASAASALAIRLAWVAAFGIAVHEIGVLIGAVREQMQQVVDLADKAGKAGVDPQFWQAWLSGARNAKIEVKDLEDALQHAGAATRDKLNPDWSVWDTGLKKVTDIEKAMRDMRELFSTDQNFTGLDLFRNAKDTPDRVRAVLTYMVQLQAIGQDLAALDLGEKMFGSKFVDDVRQGKTSAQEMLDALNKFGSSGWSNEVVNSAKDIDVKLKQATDTLNRELHPAFENLVKVGLELKSTWADIINLLAKAVALVSYVDQVGGKFLNFVTNQQTKESGAPAGTMSPEAALSLQRFRPSQGFDEAGFAIGAFPNGKVPLPARRPSDAPKAKPDKEEADTKDAFDTATDSINKQIAALTADAAAVGKTAAEHQQLRVEMRLLEAARQSGIEITDKQIADYATLRASMGSEQALAAAGIKLDDDQATTFAKLSNNIRLVAAALDDKKRAFQGVNEAVRFAGNQLVDVIDRATQRGARFGDIMSDVMRNVAKQMLQAAITGEGAFAKLFGTASTTGGAGGLAGIFAGLFASNPTVPGAPGVVGIAGSVAVPTFPAADGGVIPPNSLGLVSEHSPGGGRFVRTGSEPLFVTPGDIASAGGGAGNHSLAVSINLAGANGDDTIRAIAYEATARGVRTALAQVPGIAVKSVSEHAARFQ